MTVACAWSSGPNEVTEIARLAAAEQGCCRSSALRWSSTTGAQPWRSTHHPMPSPCSPRVRQPPDRNGHPQPPSRPWCSRRRCGRCAACCAGPIVGFLAATGIASLVGAVVFGVIGLLVVLASAAVVWQRRRDPPCAPPAGPAPLDAPRLRIKTPR